MKTSLKEIVLNVVYGKKNYFSGRRRNEPTPVTYVTPGPNSPLNQYFK